MFSKLHFEVIAADIHQELIEWAKMDAQYKDNSYYPAAYALKELVDQFCRTFSKDNENFSRLRFITACGFESSQDSVDGNFYGVVPMRVSIWKDED